MIEKSAFQRDGVDQKRHTGASVWMRLLCVSAFVASNCAGQSVTPVILTQEALRFAAVDSRGNAVTLQDGRIAAYDPTGGLALVLPLPPINAFLTTFALDSANRIYVGGFDSQNTATIVSPTRPTWTCALNGTSFRPVGIVFDAQNNPIVLGSDGNLGPGIFNTRVVKLDLNTGAVLAEFRFPASTPTAIATDAAGRIYVAGVIGDATFPTTPGAYQEAPTTATWQAFAARLDPSLQKLTASTLVAGLYPSAIAAGPDGSMYLAGSSPVPVVPTTPGAFQPNAPQHSLPPTNPPRSIFLPLTYGWILHFSADATKLLAGTYLAGNGSDGVASLSVDAAGNPVVSGYTQSTDFPATGASAVACGPEGVRQFFGAAFITKLDANLTTVVSSALVPQTVLETSSVFSGDTVYGTAFLGERIFRIDLNASSPVACIVNGASYISENVVAAGQLLTVFGTGLSDVTVSYSGVPVPILAQLDTQINVMIPSNFSPGEGNLELRFRGALIRLWPMHTVEQNPTPLLRFNDSGKLVYDADQPTALADALNEDGTRNSADNPAHANSTVTIFATGFGQVTTGYVESYGTKYPVSVDAIADRTPAVRAVRFQIPPVGTDVVSTLPFRLGAPVNENTPAVFIYVAK